MSNRQSAYWTISGHSQHPWEKFLDHAEAYFATWWWPWLSRCISATTCLGKLLYVRGFNIVVWFIRGTLSYCSMNFMIYSMQFHKNALTLLYESHFSLARKHTGTGTERHWLYGQARLWLFGKTLLWIIGEHCSGSVLALLTWLFGHSSLGEHGSCSSGEHGSGSPGTPQFWPYSAINSRLFTMPQMYKILRLDCICSTLRNLQQLIIT